MCFPGAAAVVSVMQSVVSFAAAQQDYQARAKQWRQNVTNSLASGRDEQRQLSLRMLQEEDAFVDAQHQNTIEGAEAVATAEVAGNSAGASGISLGNIIAGMRQKLAMRQTNEDTNYRNTVAQLTTEMDATNNRIRSRINSVQRPTAPNPLGYVLQGIGGALKTA